MIEVGRIDIEKFKGVTEKNILTDEVILTNNQKNHIIERRGRDFYNEYSKYFTEIIQNPDYIFKDKNKDTAIVSKSIIHKGTAVNLAIRLAVEGDNPLYKNSIITAIKENPKRFAQRLRNNTPIYRLDKKE